MGSESLHDLRLLAIYETTAIEVTGGCVKDFVWGISLSVSVQYCQYDANTREGMMTVRIVDMQTELAQDPLVQRLTDLGFVIRQHPESTHHLEVECETDESTTVLENTLLTFIFTEWQYAYMERALRIQHSYLTDDEREYVALLAYHTIRKEDGSIAGQLSDEWKARVQEAIQAAVDSESMIVLDSLIRFRLRNYLGVVDTVVDDMVEQFLTDREYEEFVAMLRYMLDSQTTSHQVLHVYTTDELVWIGDAQGGIVRDSEVKTVAEQVTDDGDVNAEDLAMSVLITRSPEKIVLHDNSQAAPWPSFAETVERVFLGRVVRCAGCVTCTELRRSATDPPTRDDTSSMHLT